MLFSVPRASGMNRIWPNQGIMRSPRQRDGATYENP